MSKISVAAKNNLLPYKGEVYYFADCFAGQADDFYTKLIDEVPWKQTPVKIFGKEILQPRLTAWYGDAGSSYTYSGLTLTALPWTEILLKIKRRAGEVAGTDFNSALLNLYRDGN